MINGRKNAKTGHRRPPRNTGGGVLEVSDRLHLTSREVEQLIEATKGSRNEARDRCLLLLMFRHGLRVSEACRLKLDQVDTESRVLHVARLKGGLSTTQPLRRRRASGNRRLAQATRPDETNRQELLCQRAA